MGILSQLSITKEINVIHNQFKYNNINALIFQRKEDLENEITKLIKDASKRKKSLTINIDEKTTRIIQTYINHNSILYKSTDFNTNTVSLNINDTVLFITDTHFRLKEVMKTEQNMEQKELLKSQDDGWGLAYNDQIHQNKKNMLKSLRYRFLGILIEELTINSSFSPITKYQLESLQCYEELCKLEQKINLEKDIFNTIGEEMEKKYNSSDVEKFVLYSLYKIFDSERLDELKKNITENYLYLLTKKSTKETFFLAKLFNDVLCFHCDLNMLYGIRKIFSKYLFKKQFQTYNENFNPIRWQSVIKECKLN